MILTKKEKLIEQALLLLREAGILKPEVFMGGVTVRCGHVPASGPKEVQFRTAGVSVRSKGEIRPTTQLKRVRVSTVTYDILRSPGKHFRELTPLQQRRALAGVFGHKVSKGKIVPAV